MSLAGISEMKVKENSMGIEGWERRWERRPPLDTDMERKVCFVESS